MHSPREVLSVGEEPNRRDSFGPGGETFARVRLVNSAERDERERRERTRGLSQSFEPDGRAVGALRGRVEDGAKDREVRAAFARRARLPERVRRDSYQKILAERAAHDARFERARREMHAVAARRARDVCAVVDAAARLAPARERRGARGEFEERASRQSLLAYLHERDARSDGKLDVSQ